MTFREVLDSEHRWLVEELEWGSSDQELMEDFKQQLFEKTGFKYQA